jgi:hypothetical protein
MTIEEAERLFSAGPAGVAEWNRRRTSGEPIPNLEDVDFWRKELPGINLSGARLSGAQLFEAVLTHADFRQADLSWADFASAKVSGACFVEADLRRARFGVFSLGLGHSGSCADLEGADFSRARLCGADLSDSLVRGARFCGADLTGADLRYSNFSEADLSDAILVDLIQNPPPPPAPAITFGPWLRRQREFRGWTHADLARQLGLGLCHIDVKQLESRQRCDSLQVLIRIAEVFGVASGDVPG